MLGITVLPEYIQVEGIHNVLDRLQAAHVTDVATSPYVMELADEVTGSREPPRDAGAGEVRLLDRPLWNDQRELWVRTAPSFTPDTASFQDLRYQPPPTDSLTQREGGVVAEFLDEAKRRGLRTFFQIQAAIPPAFRVQFGGPQGDDLPQLPSGDVPQNRVANQGSLASPHIHDYQHALIGELLRNYPQLSGIRFDWPEYPPYKIDSAFVDFGPHAKQSAAERSIDWSRMQETVDDLYRHLHGGLTNADLVESADASWRERLGQAGISDWLALKEDLSFELLKGFRDAMNRHGGAAVELTPSAFPPPWSKVSGMNLSRAAEVCDSVAVKLYGMHWAMMLHFYGTQLLAANPALDEKKLVHWLVRVLDIDDTPRDSLADYQYPGPDSPHPVGADAQRRKIAAAKQAAGSMPIHVLAHGYGPVSDFASRIETAWRSEADGVWINRYGYLSDEKLEVVASLAE